MRKLVLFLMALIAVATFIRAYTGPEGIPGEAMTASYENPVGEKSFR